MRNIAVLTSGGDAPGMNACLRAVVRKALYEGYNVYGVRNGYRGLVDGDYTLMNRKSVAEKLNRGGTFLGSARLPEFKEVEVREKAIAHMKRYDIDTLIAIGGDGTYQGAAALSKMGINVIALPGTIDNDITTTDYTIGFDTALNTIVENIDKLRDTSSSHNRCTIVEVMGRRCPDLAVHSGLATGAEYIITHESGFSEDKIIKSLNTALKNNKRHALVIITEHVTDTLELAKRIEKRVGIESRATILGHIQRGGTPTAFDRVLASRMGHFAVELLNNNVNNKSINIKDNKLVGIDIDETVELNKDSNSSMDIHIVSNELR